MKKQGYLHPDGTCTQNVVKCTEACTRSPGTVAARRCAPLYIYIYIYIPVLARTGKAPNRNYSVKEVKGKSGKPRWRKRKSAKEYNIWIAF